MMNPYHIAHNNAILIDLNSRGRLCLGDRDRLDLLHRMSTNELNGLAVGEGAETVLTTPIGRIIDLLLVLNAGETAYAITGEGRGEMIHTYLRRNIFFNDRISISRVDDETRLYGLYGVRAADWLEQVYPEARSLKQNQFIQAEEITLVRVAPLAGDGYWIMGQTATIESLRTNWLAAGLSEAENDTYDLLRVEAGQPVTANELTSDYIPLEAGLWHAVSFNKGCYTGQEIIARMESRGKLAKLLVRLSTDHELTPGTNLLHDGERVGSLTSIAPQPGGSYLGLGFVKPIAVSENGLLRTEDGHNLKLLGIAGTQPNR